MGPFLSSFISSAVILGAAAMVVWGISLQKKDVSIVDLAWGPAFAVVAWSAVASVEQVSARGLLLALMVTAWGVRLGAHLTMRNWGRPEDFRYQAMRRRAGAGFAMSSLYSVFWLQAGLVLIISTPLHVAITAPAPASLGALDALGFAVWGVGLYFEAMGDWQLAQFKADPANKGRVMNQGLWRYTRHPNYFGDCLVWWGYFLFALSAPWGWLSVIGPAIMTWLLLKVSGVALLERTITERRPEYAAYIERTSAFFPLPPGPRRRAMSPRRG